MATARWTTMDPADEFHSPYVYVGGDPVNLVDPDGMASSPTDIILQGRNGSSVTIVTDLIDVSVDVSALPGTDFGGTYSLRGDDVLLAGLDLVGTFDPTPTSDALAASIYAGKGSYLDAAISGIGIIPVFGDVGKLARVNRHVDAVQSAIRSGGRLAPSVADQASEISHAIRRNRVSIGTSRGEVLHYDLRGATHKGVATPHVQRSVHNTNPQTGETFLNKDRKWVRPMNQQDVRTVRRYLDKQ